MSVTGVPQEPGRSPVFHALMTVGRRVTKCPDAPLMALGGGEQIECSSVVLTLQSGPDEIGEVGVST